LARISNPAENDRGSAPKPLNGKSILLAEDDPFISRMYQTKLTSAGYGVTLVNNGRDAYEQIKSLDPDLIIMDINMPELSGFEVINAIKNEGSSSILDKTIVLTNSANPADHKQADDLGVDYMIKAEMTPRDVLEHINKKLGL
jgi:CheY-like chemotaxis protein